MRTNVGQIIEKFIYPLEIKKKQKKNNVLDMATYPINVLFLDAALCT